MEKIWILIVGMIFVAILLSHDFDSKPVGKPIGSGWGQAAKSTIIQIIDNN